MREQIADICRKAKYSIKNFKSDPVNNLEYLIPIAIFLIGIINGIVTQRAFAHNGGWVQREIYYRNYRLDPTWLLGQSHSYFGGDSIDAHIL